jgi:hypothetical protein
MIYFNLGRTQIQVSLEFLDLDTVQQSRNNVLPIAIVNLPESPDSYRSIFTEEFVEELLKDKIPYQGGEVDSDIYLVSDMAGIWDILGEGYGWSNSTEKTKTPQKPFCHYCDACPNQCQELEPKKIIPGICFSVFIFSRSVSFGVIALHLIDMSR